MPQTPKDNITFLLNKDLFKNEKQIAEQSLLLSPEERTELFAKYEKSAVKGALLNLIPFGIGSWVLGDKTTGTVLTCTTTGAVLSGAATYLFFIVDLMIKALSFGQSGATSSSLVTYCLAGLTTGLVVFNVAYGICRPITYTRKYNAALKSALHIDEPAPAVSVLPLVTVDRSGKGSIGAGIQVSL